MSVNRDPLPGSHQCTKMLGSMRCPNIVPHDDEPFCYTHSPDSGSSVPGYSYQAMNTCKYMPLVFKGPADAARVVTELLTRGKRSSPVTVAYLHEICDVSGHFTDTQWGWTYEELKKFDIDKVEDGYELVLPDPKRV